MSRIQFDHMLGTTAKRESGGDSPTDYSDALAPEDHPRGKNAPAMDNALANMVVAAHTKITILRRNTMTGFRLGGASELP